MTCGVVVRVLCWEVRKIHVETPWVRGDESLGLLASPLYTLDNELLKRKERKTHSHTVARAYVETGCICSHPLVQGYKARNKNSTCVLNGIVGTWMTKSRHFSNKDHIQSPPFHVIFMAWVDKLLRNHYFSQILWKNPILFSCSGLIVGKKCVRSN